VVIDDGRIVERGTHPELLACEGLYQRMWSDHIEAQGASLADAVHGLSQVGG